MVTHSNTVTLRANVFLFYGSVCFSIVVLFFSQLLVAATSTEPHLIAHPLLVEQSRERLIVRFTPGFPGRLVSSMHQSQRANVARNIASVPGMQIISLPPEADIQAVISFYERNPNVVFVEADHVMSADAISNDSYADQLWGLENTGQSVNGSVSGVADVDLNVSGAWARVSGDGDVVVAVLDSGINYNHPDLIDNVWVNPGEIAGNGIDDDGNGIVDDIHGINGYTLAGMRGGASNDPADVQTHGSHIAGIIAAVRNNGIGVAGVATQAKVLACRIGDANGRMYVSAAIICLDYLYNLKTRAVYPINIVVSNNSWGGDGYNQGMYEAIKAQMNAGILFVASAGNTSTDNDVAVHYPDGYFLPNVISVAAINNAGTLSSFSSYGRRSVHVAAPGENIVSTVSGSTYAYMDGTSMAAPHVSGLIALLAEENSSRDWKTLKNLIVSSGARSDSLVGKLVSASQVRAIDSGGQGAMSCSDQVVKALQWPRSATVNIPLGGRVGLSMMHINCASPAGGMTVSTASGSTMMIADVVLKDDGKGFDVASGDGLYSAYWYGGTTPGEYTLTFPDGQNLIVYVDQALKPYRQPVQVPYHYEDLSYLTPFKLGESSYFRYVSTFPIKFGDSVTGYSVVHLTGNGLLSFSTPYRYGVNGELPLMSMDTSIMPFWDELYTRASADGGVRAATLGTSPNRRYVFEWINIGHKALPSGLISFQVVFFENSSKVRFNYKDVTFGHGAYDGGASATVGVQVSSLHATQYSLNTPSLVSQQSLEWYTDTNLPVANAGHDQNVTVGSQVTLAGSGYDPDGAVVSYQWFQTSGEDVALSDNHKMSATFTAPLSIGSMSFLLVVTDDAGQSSVDTVYINVTPKAEPGIVGFVSSSYSLSEAQTQVDITVSRTDGKTGSIEVTYTSHAVTAIDDMDIMPVTGVLKWSDGDSTNKTFSIFIINDQVAEPNETFQVSLSSASNGATIGRALVEVTVVDDDSAAVVVSATSGLVTGENGEDEQVSIVLTSQPTENVNIQLYSNDTGEGSVSLSEMIFTPDNWNTPQVLIISGVDDYIDDGDQAYSIIMSILTDDSMYQTQNIDEIKLVNIDDDISIIRVSNNTVTVIEGTLGIEVQVHLAKRPVADVAIGLMVKNPRFTVSTSTLVFTVNNWDKPQRIYMHAVDDKLDNKNVKTELDFIFEADVVNYGQLVAKGITVNVVDNDFSPIQPTLIGPGNGFHVSRFDMIDIKWNMASDDFDGDDVRYNLFICKDPTFAACSQPFNMVPLQLSENGLTMGMTLFASVAGGGAGLAMLGMVGVMSAKRRLLMALLIIISSLVLGACGGGLDSNSQLASRAQSAVQEVSYSIGGLDAETVYYWKVVADDGNGNTTESDVWTFTVE